MSSATKISNTKRATSESERGVRGQREIWQREDASGRSPREFRAVHSPRLALPRLATLARGATTNRVRCTERKRERESERSSRISGARVNVNARPSRRFSADRDSGGNSFFTNALFPYVLHTTHASTFPFDLEPERHLRSRREFSHAKPIVDPAERSRVPSSTLALRPLLPSRRTRTRKVNVAHWTMHSGERMRKTERERERERRRR